jgi:hypothetical protein
MNRRRFFRLCCGFLAAVPTKNFDLRQPAAEVDPSKWHELYHAAVVETDPRKIPYRAGRAMHVMVQREIDLSQRRDSSIERHILPEALMTVERMAELDCPIRSEMQSRTKQAGRNFVCTYAISPAFPVRWS